jgi:predicted GTPase
LGETGVGKSTLINALYNYTKSDSLESAEAKDQIDQLIGSSFSYVEDVENQDYKSHLISSNTETEDNECFQIGQSSTQKAKMHTFRHNGDLIRIIDTPGMGDVRGVAVDKRNFDQTIEFLLTQEVERIDGICFLVKPDHKRMSVHFSYCFKELFSRLQKQALGNVLFCFTNTRSNFEF